MHVTLVFIKHTLISVKIHSNTLFKKKKNTFSAGSWFMVFVCTLTCSSEIDSVKHYCIFVFKTYCI